MIGNANTKTPEIIAPLAINLPAKFQFKLDKSKQKNWMKYTVIINITTYDVIKNSHFFFLNL